MGRKIAVLTAVVALACTTAGASSGYSLWDWYLIPAAAHVSGKYGTFWRTDLSIVNPYQWRSITVYVTFLQANRDNRYGAPEVSYTVPAGRSLTIPDVVYTAFGITGNGALLVRTKDGAYFSVSARTYTGDAATYGQTENGQKSINRGGYTAYIGGLREDAYFRSNIGAVNASNRSISLRVEVYDSAGSLRGARVLDLQPWSQTQVAVSSFASGFSSGHAKITCTTEGDDLQWVAYASVVDNNSGDAVFLEERCDRQYTFARPQYDLSGWWHANAAGSQGAGEAYAYFVQDGAELNAWLYYPDGSIQAHFWGYEDRGQLVFEDIYIYHAYCWDSRIVSADLRVIGNTIQGFFTIEGEDPYRCLDGTYTFFAEPMSYTPFSTAPVVTGEAQAGMSTPAE